jgi:hypothetical protein
VAVLAVQQSRGRPRSQFYEVAHRIAARMEPAVRLSFLRAVERLKGMIDISALEAAIRTGDTVFIERAAKVDMLSHVLAEDDGIRDALLRASMRTGSVSMDVLAGATGLEASFNVAHPNVVLYARTQAARLIVQVSEDQREAVRIVVALAAERGIPVARQAQAIREIVGLRPSHAAAPSNLGKELRDGRFTSSRRLSAVDKARIRKRIRDGTVDEAFVAEMEARYARSLLNRRALDIARTETLDASHHGLRESWKQARDQGVLPATARRMYIVTPDDRLRETHAAVPGMNPEGVALDQPFQTPLGPMMGPPIEPLCRCGEGLVFPGRKGVL